MQSNQGDNGNNRHDGKNPSPNDTRRFAAHRVISPGPVNLTHFKKNNSRQ